MKTTKQPQQVKPANTYPIIFIFIFKLDSKSSFSNRKSPGQPTPCQTNFENIYEIIN